MNTSAHEYEDMMLNRHLDSQDLLEQLAQLSYSELTEMTGEARNSKDAELAATLDSEMAFRRNVAYTALKKMFLHAVEHKTTVLMIMGGAIRRMLITHYLYEVMSTNEGSDHAMLMLMTEDGRRIVLDQLAARYAHENSESLLKAGWSPDMDFSL